MRISLAGVTKHEEQGLFLMGVKFKVLHVGTEMMGVTISLRFAQ
jgi:hypothetical protein